VRLAAGWRRPSRAGRRCDERISWLTGLTAPAALANQWFFGRCAALARPRPRAPGGDPYPRCGSGGVLSPGPARREAINRRERRAGDERPRLRAPGATLQYVQRPWGRALSGPASGRQPGSARRCRCSSPPRPACGEATLGYVQRPRDPRFPAQHAERQLECPRHTLPRGDGDKRAPVGDFSARRYHGLRGLGPLRAGARRLPRPGAGRRLGRGLLVTIPLAARRRTAARRSSPSASAWREPKQIRHGASQRMSRPAAGAGQPDQADCARSAMRPPRCQGPTIGGLQRQRGGLPRARRRVDSWSRQGRHRQREQTRPAPMAHPRLPERP
jgi:hypothetical protein